MSPGFARYSPDVAGAEISVGLCVRLDACELQDGFDELRLGQRAYECSALVHNRARYALNTEPG